MEDKIIIKNISIDSIDIHVIQAYLCASPIYSHDDFLCVLNEINNKFLNADVSEIIQIKGENRDAVIKSKGD
jgi:hypothetical protein